MLIKNSDNKLVLVYAYETFSLAIDYVQYQIDNLKTFCEENGFGFSVMNTSLKTYEEIKSVKVNAKALELLESMFNVKNRVYWRDIQEIRKYAPLSREELVSFILNNNLAVSGRYKLTIYKKI